MTDTGKISTLAIHPGALGDVILFARLLELLPHPVAVVTGGEKAKVLEGLGVVERAFAFESLAMHEVFTDGPIEKCSLASGPIRSCDRVVSCFGGDDQRSRQRLAPLFGAGECSFLPIRPENEYPGHLVDLWREMLKVESPVSRHPWPVPPEWITRTLPPSSALLQPGSGGRDKCWPLDSFIKLARGLERCGHNPVFILGPAEMERLHYRQMLLMEGFEIVTCPSLKTLCGMLASCRVYIGNDSGVSHLAGVLGARCVVLFGASCPRHFAPIGPRVKIISGRKLDDMSPDAVLGAVARYSSLGGIE